MAHNNLSDDANGNGKRSRTQSIAIEDLVSNDSDAESFEVVPSDEAVLNENNMVVVADSTEGIYLINLLISCKNNISC